jgi:uncharacterized surface protein with fasciclin (FAS1) repeats
MYDDHYWLPGPLPAGANGTVTAYDPYKPSASESDFPGLQVATVDFVVSDGGDCIRQLGSLRGTAFEDIDANGKWDAGEPKMGLAWYKVTDGGGWYVCGWVGSDGTYGVPVTAGRYDVLPVTLNGYRTTTPRIHAKVEAGQASLGNDIGFVKDPVARLEACDAYNPPRPGKPRIIETANRAGTFTILMTALEKAGLVEMLDGEGPWTLFAPTDAAFARLPAGAVEALLGDPAALKSFALRHAIAGDWRAVDLSRQASIRMLDGAPASIEMVDGAVLIEGSAIGTPDILTGNGVLHVIDRVLLPPPR